MSRTWQAYKIVATWQSLLGMLTIVWRPLVGILVLRTPSFLLLKSVLHTLMAVDADLSIHTSSNPTDNYFRTSNGRRKLLEQHRCPPGPSCPPCETEKSPNVQRLA